MGLSLRRPAEPTSRPAPVPAMPRLRLWPVDHLLLHEEADAARVRRLADALLRDGLLRNPPVVAPLDDGRAVVLDGANRVTALCALRLPHAVVQEIAYEDPAVRLSVWRHYVREHVPGRLRAAALSFEATAVEDEDAAQSRIATGDALASVIDGQGGLVLPRAATGAAGAETLRRLAGLYRDAPATHRIEEGTLEDARAAYGPGALVLFRRFEKAEIVALALEGGRLPAGITRHVIPGRALRVNTPLAWLAADVDPAATQTALDAQVRQRWQAHGVRYYSEPTFLFDE